MPEITFIKCIPVPTGIYFRFSLLSVYKFFVNCFMLTNVRVIKLKFKLEPEPGWSVGSGCSQIPRLRLQNQLSLLMHLFCKCRRVGYQTAQLVGVGPNLTEVRRQRCHGL